MAQAGDGRTLGSLKALVLYDTSSGSISS